MPTFIYGEREIAYLSGRDPVLGAYMAEVGPIARETNPDPFAALINSIVGQQISVKAHESVWNRLQNALGEVNPAQIAAKSREELRACGLSGRKVEYIQEAARRTLAGEFDWRDLEGRDDETLIQHLTALRGVGRWTVEMLLIFSLLRPDVLSHDDLAIRRGICRLYNWKTVDKKRFARLKKRYSPHGSVASLYLWHRAARE